MGPPRRRSLLEDDELDEIVGRDESSGGDVCERCGFTRDEHEGGAAAKQQGTKKIQPCAEFVD